MKKSSDKGASKPKITTVTLSKSVKLSKSYQSFDCNVSMTAEVGESSLNATKKKLRIEVDKFLKPRVKEALEFLEEAAKSAN